MPNYEAVVFDLYDTLVYFISRTKPLHRMITDLKLTPEQIQNAGYIATTQNFNSISEFASVLKPDHELYIPAYEKDLEEELKLVVVYPETIKTLERLRKEKIKLGLISNLGTPYKKPFFDLHLNSFFDEIVFSCDAGFRKPEPQIYHAMLKKLNLPAEKIIMTGDNFSADVEGPKTAGMDAVLLDREKKSPQMQSIGSLEEIFDYVL